MHEATIHLPDGRLASIGLAEVVAAARNAGLDGLTELITHGSGSVLHVRVREPLPEPLLDDAGSIAWWGRLDLGSAGVDYLCAVEPVEQSNEGSLARGGTDGGTSVDDPGVALSVVGSRDAIGRSVAAGEGSATTPLLERLTEFPASGSSPVDGLTGRQLEVLRTAHELGYYEVPRQASSREIADAVDLDPSTVCEHLQRAERNIVEDVLDTPV